jgi:hypothetical protein
MNLTKIIALAFKRPVRVLLNLVAYCGSLLIAVFVFVAYSTAQAQPIAQAKLPCIAKIVWLLTAQLQHTSTRQHTTTSDDDRRDKKKGIFYPYQNTLYNRQYLWIIWRRSSSLSLLYRTAEGNRTTPKATALL